MFDIRMYLNMKRLALTPKKSHEYIDHNQIITFVAALLDLSSGSGMVGLAPEVGLSVAGRTAPLIIAKLARLP